MSSPTFTVNAKELAEALALVMAAAEKGDYVLIEGANSTITLTATDTNSVLQTRIETDCDAFAWCVRGADVSNLVRLLSGDVSFSESKGKVTAKTANTEHRLSVLRKDTFPAIESAPERLRSIKGELLASMLTTALIAAETNENAPQWQQNLEIKATGGKLSVTGCSNARISNVTTKFDAEFEANIPLRGARVLAIFATTAETVEIACSNNLFSLYSDTGAAHSRLAASKMAAWQMLISETYQHAIELSPETTLLSVKRALLASQDGAVNFSLSKSEAVLTATLDDGQREGREVAPITCPTLNGSTYDLRLMGEQLADYLKLCKSPVTWQINEGQSAMMFKLKDAGEFDWQYIQTTLRVK